MDQFLEKQIARCLDAEDKLTEWEYDFLNSIAGRNSLTEKQKEVLNRIVHKIEFD